MNLVPVYIKEIHTEELITYKGRLVGDTYVPGGTYMSVTMTINCYGNIETITKQFTVNDWPAIKEAMKYEEHY